MPLSDTIRDIAGKFGLKTQAQRTAKMKEEAERLKKEKEEKEAEEADTTK
jgi:hypothetical protein